MAVTPITDPTRTVEGHTVPAAGSWVVDKGHSSVEFVARHLMVTKVRGRFSDYDAAITIAERPEDSSVDVTIHAGSITTGDPGRDGHLTSADFLDVEQFPTIAFKSNVVHATGSSTWDVEGDLTVHGVTKPVTFDFDGTLQGLARTDRPAFCFQGHPEASPGPHDISYLFDRFTGLMDERKGTRG